MSPAGAADCARASPGWNAASAAPAIKLPASIERRVIFMVCIEIVPSPPKCQDDKVAQPGRQATLHFRNAA